MKGIVITPIAPLMTKPQYDCELADETMCGMVVELGEREGEYVRVTTEYRYSGYMPVSCLLTDESRVESWEKASLCWVMRSSLDVQADPRVQSWQLTTLPRGARVLALEEPAEGWQKVELPDGRAGYVRASGLTPVDTTPWEKKDPFVLRSALVRTALSYMGSQYRWGGKTAWGIDCSGLCSVSYLLHGIQIHRDASLEPGFPLKEIDMSRMAEGDLIFFPGHVAMYIGDGKYVHATARAGSDAVVINSLRPEDPDFRQDLLDSITKIGSLF